jgi:alkylated DNA repair dioxygenase AlkB
MEIIFQEKNSFLAKGRFKNNNLLERCINDVKPKLYEKPAIKIFNKTCFQQRNVGFFSNESIGYSYSYSNQLMKSQQLTKDLEMLLNEVNEIFNFKFNGILVNEYLDGNDYISAHSDDEKGLDEVVGVILLSYGVERIFRIRDKKTKKN